MNTFEAIHGGENHRLWIGGHRGHASATRENTTANFAEVLGMGVDYIEIDVQLTRDRQAVIFHDMALEERTPLHGHIRDYTVAELKAAFEIDIWKRRWPGVKRTAWRCCWRSRAASC